MMWGWSGKIEKEVAMAEKKSKKKDGGRIKTALFLDPKQIEALKSLQDAVGVPMSVSIRRAIDMYLETLAKEKK